MLRRIDLRGSVRPPGELRSILPRADVDVDSVAHLVRPIVDDVAARGVSAVLEYTERFDKVRPAAIRRPAKELTTALDPLDPARRAALPEAVDRVPRVPARQP